MTHVFIVEDDPKLGRFMADYLAEQSYQTSLVTHVTDARVAIAAQQPDIVILDLMLPDGNGLALCQELRTWYQGVILILTAVADDMDQVAALEMGADDYIQKPVLPRVLLARLRALQRRASPVQQTTAQATEQGRLRIDSKRRRAFLDGVDIQLTESEYELLVFLFEHIDQIQSRDATVQATRGIAYDGLDRTTDTKVASLRKKLGDRSANPQIIITVRGKGYLLASAGLANLESE